MNGISRYTTSHDYGLYGRASSLIDARHHVKELSVEYAIAKRALDVTLATVVLVATSPLLLAIALFVRLTSPGPSIFRQVRVGRGGRPFTCYKFRTMYQEAEKLRGSLAGLNEVSGPVFKIRHDPRVTPFGRLLRHTSLDEVPQLLNVLFGDMSIVGPRPPLPSEVCQYGARELRRLEVKPGLTCLWQVNGRSDIEFDRWVDLDLAYIDNMSLRADLAIILKTIPAVLTARGAY